ncbi:MAG: penicillin-binding protein 2 [Rhodospirillales bacterium]|jgi:penicillin-binding protein 2|nr:penicillin-binding protein 2 [Rhodospirillales bacterium]MBT4039611.1 penicillin-binding protein 2 [Rhodospirillales bacterium]MBT4627737.1 penicillin-binding protein 2 [Rhodospirillales bacterium]MBT5351046.1 penicillin-binding protein 2 [Rhodospirillales bacterium]MBT5521450.1 penicillin-binding protein 2 [Rhodospirillales bacterium]
MHRDSDRHKLFSRRAAMLAGGQFVLLTALTGRLYYLQVVESEKYKNLADENRINFRLLAPPRGRITDRNGSPIADNQQNYRLLLISENTTSVDSTLDALENIIPLSDKERRRILRDVKRNRSFVPVTVRENLIWSQVSQIEVNTPDLPGVLIDVGESRYYPHGEDFAHVLGYVAPVSEGEATGDPLLELPGFRIGKAGMEKVHDLALRGTGGNSEVEVNAYGRIIRELSRQDGEPGAEVQLTIDMELQRLAAERIADESAAVVVMDIHNGEVLTLASTPSFDPNKFNQGLSSAEWSNLVNNPKSPLTNKATRGEYAPGSTFKMIVALAALEHGIITPETEFWCSGKMKLGNAVFHCWRKEGHGRVNCTKALTQSCDVYFYEVAKRLGITRISEMARRLGLGEPLGIDLPHEKGGLVPSPEWKLAEIGTSWQKGETVILGIGQGYILVTPLQLAVMTARLANGGIAVTPHLTRQVISTENTDEQPPTRDFESIGLVPEHLDIVTDGMVRVVNTPHGTAFRARIKEDGMSMAGKSGTVQVHRISKAEREVGVTKNKDLEWKERDHALFVAYAPVDNPRYAISVVVEHGGGGSSVAAPIARDILREVQKRKIATPLGATETTSEREPEGQPETEPSNG